MTDAERWAEYEAEKQKLQQEGLSAAEYQEALKALADRLHLMRTKPR